MLYFDPGGNWPKYSDIMKAFVTGGTGFIGSHLVDKLLDDPAWTEVRCLVRNQEKWLKGKPYQKIEGDLCDIQSLKNSLVDVDVLFHLAGVVKAPAFKVYEQVNVEGTENLIRMAHREGVKKVVVLSSLAAAGPSEGRPLNENDPMKPVSRYGRSKMMMEKMLHTAVSTDQSVTVIRPPVVYGPREEQLYTYFKILNKRFSPIIGDGESVKISMVYVSDLLEGIQLAAGNRNSGLSTYFMSGPETYTWNHIKKVSSVVLNKRLLTVKLNPSWIKNIAGAVETTASFFGTYPVFNREKANEMILQWTCTSDKAKKELNYLPDVTLEEGISRTIRWYKQHHWL